MGAFVDELYVLANGGRTLLAKLRQYPVGLQPAGSITLAAGGKVAAPRLGVEPFHHLGAQRVKHHVARQFQQIAVALHQDGFVAALEYVPRPPVRAVETLGVDPVELAYACGRLASGGSSSRW